MTASNVAMQAAVEALEAIIESRRGSSQGMREALDVCETAIIRAMIELNRPTAVAVAADSTQADAQKVKKEPTAHEVKPTPVSALLAEKWNAAGDFVLVYGQPFSGSIARFSYTFQDAATRATLACLGKEALRLLLERSQTCFFCNGRKACGPGCIFKCIVCLTSIQTCICPAHAIRAAVERLQIYEEVKK